MFNNKGQATIDLLIVLSISLIALSIIYALYAEQIETTGASKEAFAAKTAVQKIVDAANKLQLSGPGSKTSVFFELPQSIDLSDSNVYGRAILIKLSNTSSIVGTADVNFSGSLRDRLGKQVIYLDYNGSHVIISYKDFELNKKNISITAFAGTNNNAIVTVRNNYESNVTFFIQNSFSHNEITFSSDPITTFTLSPNQLQTISFDFDLDSNAYGNYAGSSTIIGQIGDTNYYEKINIGVEAQLPLESVIIYPLNTNFTAASPSTTTKSFSVCNNSSTTFDDLSWSNAGSINTWFTEPSFADLNNGSCIDFDIDFAVPGGASGTNTGTLIVDYNSSNDSYTSNVAITIS
jgi:hypothetical protein